MPEKIRSSKALTGKSFMATFRERSLMSSIVRIVAKISPCHKQSIVSVTPPVMVYRFTISEKPAFICMLRSTGNPFISAENKMPKMSGGKRLPKKITQSHAFFHACFSTFPRNSNATPRPISESNRRTKEHMTRLIALHTSLEKRQT